MFSHVTGMQQTTFRMLSMLGSSRIGLFGVWLRKSTPSFHHRSMTGVIVPFENLRGPGHKGQSGLLSCLHPITRGEYVNGLIHDAAKRYGVVEEQASKAVREHGIILCKIKSDRLSPFSAAAFTLSYEALELKSKDAQFCFGVMHWKGVGVICNLDRAVELFLMAAEQVRQRWTTHCSRQ
jgi:hypothetical protein